jgi:hypothetical protein
MNWLLFEQLLQLVAFVAAMFSAWFWLRAARVGIPPITYGGIAEDAAFVVALKDQSRFNAYAAASASLAALAQGGALLIDLLTSN